MSKPAAAPLQVQADPQTGEAEVEFPCAYPLKVVGRGDPDFKRCILDVMTAEGTHYHEESISIVDSRNGRFQSVRITITAESRDHLNQVHAALKATGRVQIVL
ncbi:hypothetical protein BFW38_10775 [Terasakiispira papahanaumokuakeensis]|uniref:UPF0250 protein BFW38_10775 n=1 Tax=Terasakiispira papahanaumokuakeensis TaxID=197479 RepID=A0A1E2VAR4_9GAMM|nr:DUF493 domain-containing protein [Terasakiispira papahanaumokuakeensis]ODC03952.1 hypothetical protein BFW38_10775 [Terasakiispira papahanaumokuakeensis]